MQIRKIDPINDPAWLALVEKHPRSSVFHTPGWLEALRRTYEFETYALTTSPPGEKLAQGIVFCRVSSWLTGQRLVSLPFSDHCEPLVDNEGELNCLLAELRGKWKFQGCKYVELRPLEFNLADHSDLSNSDTYCLHRLDLRPDLEGLYEGFHKDCVRRKIRRAEREKLVYEAGRSEAQLEKFYGLVVSTRQRQLLPPQPLNWFRNLIACLGDKLRIHLVSKNGQPVAGILTLRHKAVLVYKYGCSDHALNNLGGTQLVFWKAIQEAKRDGLQELDLGRTEWDHLGLLKFKDRWGAAQSTMTYWRYGAMRGQNASAGVGSRIAKWFIARMPKRLLTATGSILYRHFG
jgi:CelD/BcsL family acetyltransferase involved in cellulose biosynthesis